MAQGFYVQVRNGAQRGLLAGPFDTAEKAEAILPEVQRVADEVDRFAGFYDWWTVLLSTTRAGQELPTGRLNARLGLSLGTASASGLLIVSEEEHSEHDGEHPHGYWEAGDY